MPSACRGEGRGAAAVGHSRPRAMGGIARGAGSRAMWLARRGGFSAPPGSIRSSSAQTGRPAAGEGAAAVGIRARARSRPRPRRSRVGCPAPTLLACVPTQPLQSAPHLPDQLGEPPAQHARSTDEQHVDARSQGALLPAIRLADSPPNTIAWHRAAYSPAHREAHPPSSLPPAPERDEARLLVPIALPEQRLDFRGPPEPFGPPER
jgi:hypothetical protein